MANRYLLDACAVIAFLNDETGADVIQSLLEESDAGISDLYLHNLNFLEVYYGLLRDEGKEKAELADKTTRSLPITFIEKIDDAIYYEAGRIKSSYKVSLADAILLATAIKLDATVATSDHHEFDAVAPFEKIIFRWFR
jgi:predicted nucleic acid-binding protein